MFWWVINWLWSLMYMSYTLQLLFTKNPDSWNDIETAHGWWDGWLLADVTSHHPIPKLPRPSNGCTTLAAIKARPFLRQKSALVPTSDSHPERPPSRANHKSRNGPSTCRHSQKAPLSAPRRAGRSGRASRDSWRARTTPTGRTWKGLEGTKTKAKRYGAMMTVEAK